MASKILVCGWYGKSNVGDESYRTSIPALWPGTQFEFCDSLGTASARSQYDAVLLGGGNILDTTFVRSVSRLRDSGWTKPIHAFSVGCTDHSLQLEQFELLDQILVRDTNALDLIRATGYTRAKLCPDAAFALVPDKTQGQRIWDFLLSSHNTKRHKQRIIVICNTHLVVKEPDILARELTRFLNYAQDLARIIDNLDVNCIFIPFCCTPPWDDRVANSWVSSRCKWHQKNVMFYDKLSVQATLDLISASDLVISQRYHGTVFSVLSEVPFVDVYHHDKNLSFIRDINCLDWGLDYWSFCPQHSTELIVNQLQNPQAKTRLSTIKAALQTQLLGCIDDLCFA